MVGIILSTKSDCKYTTVFKQKSFKVTISITSLLVSFHCIFHFVWEKSDLKRKIKKSLFNVDFKYEVEWLLNLEFCGHREIWKENMISLVLLQLWPYAICKKYTFEVVFLTKTHFISIIMDIIVKKIQVDTFTIGSNV